jgi:aspartyl-tRNA(Asn)/glutamyl-tRNA(Gln) amidotransferase subunit B
VSALARDGASYVSRATGARWRAVIGLEVHVQLATATKLFCGCRNAFGEPPNTLVCPVCTGQPGALPALNREALDLALRVALALDCEIAPSSRFDRKHYFYCDLPKGYQISQYAEPFARGGAIEAAPGVRVPLRRIHLEEDAGKAIHDRGTETLVDLNRAGVPLIEIVSEPELGSSEDARAALAALKEVVQYTGASECDMEKGSLRCDVNVSVRREGEPLGVKVELKNLNSFAHAAAAIEREVERQIEALESGDPARSPVQETRLYDAAKGETRSMRGKEEAHDYRYMPEPDLPAVRVTRERLARLRALLPELPAARRARYRTQLALAERDAALMTSSRALADFFEAVVRHGAAPKDAASWIGNELLRIFAEPASAARSVDELVFKPFDLAELIALERGGVVQRAAAREVLAAMAASGRRPRELVRELNLERIGESGELERWCREALVGREQTVEDVKNGVDKALGALIGPVMKRSGGRADPAAVRATLLRLIRGGA